MQKQTMNPQRPATVRPGTSYPTSISLGIFAFEEVYYVESD